MKIVFQSFNIKYSDFQKFVTFRRNKKTMLTKSRHNKKPRTARSRHKKKTPKANCFRSLFVRVDFTVAN